MSCNIVQQRDFNMLHDHVCTVTPLQQVTQLVYLSYESIAFHPYISRIHGGLHLSYLSTLTLAIFRTALSNKNHITTAIPTKTCQTNKFLMQFETKRTPLPESSYMAQYFFESMFICYILQKQKGVAHNSFLDENIKAEYIPDRPFCGNTIPKMTCLCMGLCLCF